MITGRGGVSSIDVDDHMRAMSVERLGDDRQSSCRSINLSCAFYLHGSMAPIARCLNTAYSKELAT